MRLCSESNKMCVDIVDIYKKNSEIYIKLGYCGKYFEISCHQFDKSITKDDWKIIYDNSIEEESDRF